ncbi:hypothetical protein TWF481_004587 [Arthrobotrys musiformis]|uniref:Dirigent protein n=1 Tax=Arthrobotrys musiformis TaxID=47236 RepID=A0AAV9WK58_9PEZI
MVRVWKLIVFGASIIGIASSPATAVPLGGKTVNFQDLALPFGQALGLTRYAGFYWEGIEAFKPSGFSLGTPLGGNKPFAILGGVNPSNGGLTGTITSANGPVSLKSIGVICCQSTDPTKCDRPVPCTISLTGKDAQGKKIFERSFTAAPTISGRGISVVVGEVLQFVTTTTTGTPLEGITSLVIGAFGSLGKRGLVDVPITLPAGVKLSDLTKVPTGLPTLPLPTGVGPISTPKLPGGGGGVVPAKAAAAGAGALSVPRPNPTFSVPVPPMPWPFDRAKAEGLLKPKLQNKFVGPNGLVFTVRVYELAFN